MDKLWLSSYPPHVPAEIDTQQYASLVELFRHSVDRFATRPAFSNRGKIITYHELDQLSQQFAAYLRHEAGLKAGERIAIMLPNLLLRRWISAGPSGPEFYKLRTIA